jgi:diguanylate cyclase (GGDEF)-like protein
MRWQLTGLHASGIFSWGDTLSMRLRTLPARAERFPYWLKLAGLFALIAMLDYVTGEEISFAVFYVLPVGVAAWWSGRAAAYLVAILAALARYDAGLWSEHVFSQEWIRYWNALSPFLLFVLILHLVSALRSRLDEERSRADRDPLTGLLNLHAFHLQAETHLAHARRTGRPLAMVFMDLDNFKAVNDSQGHVAGNRVLQAVAHDMRRVLRESDLLARAGGDEFAVLLTEAGPEGASAAVESLRSELLKAMAEMNVPVTFSIGMVAFETPPTSVRAMVQHADQLMYEVKRSGKNAVRSAVVSGP